MRFVAARFCPLARTALYPLPSRESNCVESQANLFALKFGFHGTPDLRMAFMIESNFLMQATRATFFGLPFTLSPSKGLTKQALIFATNALHGRAGPVTFCNRAKSNQKR